MKVNFKLSINVDVSKILANEKLLVTKKEIHKEIKNYSTMVMERRINDEGWDNNLDDIDCWKHHLRAIKYIS
jgi:hypothetical protein